MKENFPLAAAGSSAKPYPRTKDNQNASKSFHERGKENQSNFIGNRDGTAHKNGEKAKQQRKSDQKREKKIRSADDLHGDSAKPAVFWRGA
jgi:hypothetical protein